MNPDREHSAQPSQPLIGRLDRLLAPLETALDLIAALFIFALMLVGVAQIFSRKLFDAPIFGYIDLVELAMATFAFLGVAYCQRLGGHVRMEILLSHLRGRTLWMVEALATVVGLIIVAILVYYGYDHFMRAYEYGDSTIDAEYPLWPSKLLVPFAFSVLWLRLALQLLGYLRLVGQPDAQPVAVPHIESIEEIARREIEEARVDEVKKASGRG
jgi:C4-dicarboxylate transporter, DctQ subunit